MLQEIWESCLLFRDTKNLITGNTMNIYFYFKIELFCRGRALFDTARTDFPLHKAVFENNLPMISRLVNCSYEGVFFSNKNELDCCGNTPLVLAVKLGCIDAVKVLCDLFTCPKLKSLPNCTLKIIILINAYI